jgi:hypothetical protein
VIHAKGKTKARRGSYGIDAPYLLAVPALLIVWNVTDGILYQRALPFFVAALLVASIGCGLYTSRRGKFIVWDRLLDGLNLRGDERILDLGCGRGAVLLRYLRTTDTRTTRTNDLIARWSAPRSNSTTHRVWRGLLSTAFGDDYLRELFLCSGGTLYSTSFACRSALRIDTECIAAPTPCPDTSIR